MGTDEALDETPAVLEEAKRKMLPGLEFKEGLIRRMPWVDISLSETHERASFNILCCVLKVALMVGGVPREGLTHSEEKGGGIVEEGDREGAVSEWDVKLIVIITIIINHKQNSGNKKFRISNRNYRDKFYQQNITDGRKNVRHRRYNRRNGYISSKKKVKSKKLPT